MYGALRSLVLEALAPTRCAGCGDPAPAVCLGCARALELLPQPDPVAKGGLRLHAAFLYSSPLREILHSGKYRDGRSALRVAAVLAAERYAALPAPAFVVPVPLGRARLRQRGYNQAETVSRAVAALLGAQHRSWLRRVRDTGTQVGRSPAARAANLSGAFQWLGPSHPAGRVWIVDDVITTGATMLAGVHAAPHAAHRDICGVALARAGEHLRGVARAPGPRHRGIMGP
ncbi:MAG: ComF family protein [Candidatus Dormibacteria bacterium]